MSEEHAGSVAFVKIPVAVLMDQRLSAEERVLYAWLVHMNRVFRGRLYPSQAYLEGVTGFKRTAIQTYLRKFRALGLITVKKRGFAANNDYDIVPIEKVYSAETLDAVKKLPAKEDIPRSGRVLSTQNLDKWWASLDDARASTARTLFAHRNKVFNHDLREIRKFKQFLFSATAWFDTAALQCGWTDAPKFELMWVAERPLDIVTKPNTCLTIDGSERAILVLCDGVRLSCNGSFSKFEESGLVVVRNPADIRLLSIHTPLERLANI